MSGVTKLVLGANGLGELRQAAARADADLLWIVDAGAVPERGALEALRDAGVRPAVSLPVNAAGSPVERLIGRYADDDVERLLAETRRRRLPLRHTYVVSLLVDRAHVLDLDPPDPESFGCYAGSEWTARLLARHPGGLVPASRVRASEPSRPSALAVLRMTRTPTWRRGETLRELHRLATG